MGEVRVKVRLTNAGDEMLYRRRRLARSKIRRLEVEAVVDTGAVRTVIPAKLARRLGLKIRGRRMAEYTDGRKAFVGVTEPLVVDIEGRDTLEEALVLGDEVLVGQTVLEKLDFLVDCISQKLIPKHSEGPVSAVK